MTEDPNPTPSISRRQLLVAGGVGLAIGAVGTEIGNLATGSSPSTTAAPPDVDLMQEHGVLKRVLMIYQESVRRISAGQQPPMSDIHSGATVIHDFIEAFHEALEEGYIFPMLRNAGLLVSTVDTLFVQHARGRQLTQLILAGSDGPSTTTSNADSVSSAMTAFVRMYEPHEAREDTVVFPTFRANHTPEQLDELAVTFADLQRQQIGPNGFAKTVATVASIEMNLGIYDLNQFTPAPPVQ
jgi:hemerythrin-like domain-containing protein